MALWFISGAISTYINEPSVRSAELRVRNVELPVRNVESPVRNVESPVRSVESPVVYKVCMGYEVKRSPGRNESVFLKYFSSL